MRVVLVCPPGFYLATDRLCHSWARTPNNYGTAANDPPAHGWGSWGRDAAIAGGGALVGIAGNQLAKRLAGAGETAADDAPVYDWAETAAHDWGATAGETAGETAAGAAVAGGEAAAGAEAGAAAEAGMAEGMMERGLLWVGETALELLPFGISSHQSWRALVRHPVYAVPKSESGKAWTRF